ncbi:MAG: polysaccharide deacetylase family protein [Actinobacteria bacterium]|nr:polysaccharide deacetylase family protein [Actinomycetota bacterium]
MRSRRQLRLPFGTIVATASTRVALSFDDGPDERITPDLLAVLAEHGVSATFFVLMSKVRRDPDLLRTVAEAGHEISLHGPDHRRITELSRRDATLGLSRAADELAAISGQTIRWYRPPYGALTARAFVAVRQSGLTPVLWSATTWDWKDVTHAQRIDKARSGAQPGSILLAHDGLLDTLDGVTGEPEVRCDRPKLIDEVLGGLREQGTGVGTVGAAIEEGDAVRSLRFLRPRRPSPWGR